jgi:hypothetical protein
MVNIIVDLRIMDAILVTMQKSGDRSIEDQKYFLNNTILQKYNITRPQFDSSYVYYQKDLKVIDEIYADAITKLSLMKGEVDEEEKEEKEEEY